MFVPANSLGPAMEISLNFPNMPDASWRIARRVQGFWHVCQYNKPTVRGSGLSPEINLVLIVHFLIKPVNSLLRGFSQGVFVHAADLIETTFAGAPASSRASSLAYQLANRRRSSA